MGRASPGRNRSTQREHAGSGSSESDTPRVGWARGAGAAMPAVFHGPYGSKPGRAETQRRAAAIQHGIAVDCRYLRIRIGRGPHSDGRARRSGRTTPAPADWRRGLRMRIDPGGVRTQRRGAHYGTRAAGFGGRDARPLDPVTAPLHVPRSEATHIRYRGLDRELLRGRRIGTADRRCAAAVLLVGVRVPDQRARHGAAVNRGPATASRVPGSAGWQAGYPQCRAVHGLDPGRGLWRQAHRGARRGLGRYRVDHLGLGHWRCICTAATAPGRPFHRSRPVPPIDL